MQSSKQAQSFPHLCNLYMPRKRTIKLRCPICKKATKTSDADFPFCSDRCRQIDLGKWASGEYVIPSPVNDDEAVADRDEEER